MVLVLSRLGALFQRSYLGALFVLALSIIFSPFKSQGNPRATFSTFVSQVYFTGVEVLPHIALLALVIGALTILQSVTVMPKLGGGDAFGGVMVAVVIRELGPLITALFIAGRTGSALSTYIGNMKILQEIDALRTMGINPVHYQLMPAFFGTLVSMFCLTMLFNLIAIAGGYFIVASLDFWFPEMFTAQLSLAIFVEKIFTSLGLMDAVVGILKPLLFGAFISVISSYHGMSVKRDVRDVPKATRMTVVRAFVLIIASDMILAIPFLLQVKDKIIL